VTLADASQQVLRYDSFGRIAEVGRPGLAKVQYDYAPATGLPVRKRVLDGDGVLERSVEWTRDAIGRVTQEVHAQPRRNASRTVSYRYDGLIDATTVPGQRGHLSEVSSADFVRTARFDRDGSALSSSLKIGGWRELEQSWTRYEDGSPKDETWIVRDGQGQELSRLVQTKLYDAWGRLSEVRVGGLPFATLAYDSEGRPDAVTLTSGGEIVHLYDATTHEKNGYWIDSGAWNGGVSWQYDNRGHIASELISLGSEVWERVHDYDARGLLTRTADAGSEALYSYGATGLLTNTTDLSSTRAITRSGRTIDAGPGGTYQLDSSGRVIGHDGLALTWGPTGEIDEATRGPRTWSYLYDEAGQRIGKREAGAMVAGYAGEVYFDAQHAVLPVKFNGQLVGTWQLTTSGNRFEQVATDPRGTLLGEDGVANLPTPYGVRVQRPAQAAALDFVERGYDADLGTVRFGARDYDPKLGQFWSPDPLFLESIEQCAGSPTECNLYGYAKGDPLSWTDPSGLGGISFLRNVIATTVEVGATLVGGAIGAAAGGGPLSPGTSGLMAVAGAGLAAGFVSPIADRIRGEKPSVTRQLNAMATGATMEMGGRIFEAGFRSLAASGVRPVIQQEVNAGLASAMERSLPNVPRSLGAAATPFKLVDRVNESTYAARLAKDMSEQAKRDVRHLLKAFGNGNVKPGLGTRDLGNKFYELRARNAGRVLVKQTSAGTFDVVAKFQAHTRGDTANSAMLEKLMRDYTARTTP
jgi:RHS repeat-associated protein